jgi:hypothetical protein
MNDQAKASQQVAEPVHNISSDDESEVPIAKPEKELEIASSISGWSGTSDGEIYNTLHLHQLY